jgi:hypothetical protein
MDKSRRANRMIEVRQTKKAEAVVCLKLDKPRLLGDAVDYWKFLPCQHDTNCQIHPVELSNLANARPAEFRRRKNRRS